MANLKTTLGKLTNGNSKDWEKLKSDLGSSDPGTEVPLSQILDSNGAVDGYWALRCWNYEDYCDLLADVAESVLPIFEAVNTEDSIPRDAVASIRSFGAGETDLETISVALGNAVDSVRAIDTDTDTAAAFAVYTVINAANAAVEASDVDNPAAVEAVNRNVRHTVENAALAASYGAADPEEARRQQWEKNGNLMRDFTLKIDGQVILEN
jgi:hypothetical protein